MMTILCFASIPSAGAIWKRSLRKRNFTYAPVPIKWKREDGKHQNVIIDIQSLYPPVNHSPWLRLRQSVTVVWCVDPVFQWWRPLQVQEWTGEQSPILGVPAGYKQLSTTATRRRSHAQTSPPPEHLLNFQTPTRKCQQSILWKLLNSLSVIGAYTLCLKSLVDQKRHVCPRSSKRRCYRYCPVGFLLITDQHVPKIVGCFWERAACSDWC